MTELMATVFWLGGIALAAWMLLIRPSTRGAKKDLPYRSILFAILVLAWSVVLFTIDWYLTAMSFDD